MLIGMNMYHTVPLLSGTTFSYSTLYAYNYYYVGPTLLPRLVFQTQIRGFPKRECRKSATKPFIFSFYSFIPFLFFVFLSNRAPHGPTKRGEAPTKSYFNLVCATATSKESHWYVNGCVE